MLIFADKEVGLHLGIYDCKTSVEACTFVAELPIDNFFPAFDGNDVDFTFFEPDSKHIFFYSYETLHIYQPNQVGQFIQIQSEYDNTTHFYNNTDAAFLFQQDGEDRAMLFKGNDVYVTDLSSMMTYTGKVTSPCLEGGLEKDELPETFIIDETK